jgi:hypothetical protein
MRKPLLIILNLGTFFYGTGLDHIIFKDYN